MPAYLSFCLSSFLSFGLSVHLYPICLSASLPIILSAYLPVCLFCVHISHLSIWLPVLAYLPAFLTITVQAQAQIVAEAEGCLQETIGRLQLIVGEEGGGEGMQQWAQGMLNRLQR